MAPRTPSQTEALKLAIWGVLTGVNTSQPAEIVKWYPDRRMADVQPTLKLKLKSGETKSKPQVRNVPVYFPGGGGFTSTHPLEPGDEVILIYSQRSLDRWLANGGEVDPADGRKFHHSDAMALAGISSIPNATPVEDGLAFFGKLDGSSGLRVHDDGKISLGTPSAELVDLVNTLATSVKDLITALQGALVADAIIGPQPLDPATQAKLAAELIEVNAALTKLGTIKV